jgi:hypothetical protein
LRQIPHGLTNLYHQVVFPVISVFSFTVQFSLPPDIPSKERQISFDGRLH